MSQPLGRRVRQGVNDAAGSLQSFPIECNVEHWTGRVAMECEFRRPFCRPKRTRRTQCPLTSTNAYLAKALHEQLLSTASSGGFKVDSDGKVSTGSM